MNRLYKIKVLHGAPKDSHESIETYLVAESDEQVFDWINRNKCYGNWCEEEEIEDGEEPEESGYYSDDDYEKPITMKEWVMSQKGDLEDENGWEDAYYGVTKWGWEEVVALPDPDEIDVLLKFGIAEHATDK